MGQQDAPAGFIALTPEQLQGVVNAAVTAAVAAAGRPDIEAQKELIAAQAEANAKAHQKLAKPENATHPGISVYSRPGGERDNPKPPFQAKHVKWAGTDVPHGTSTADEVDLLNALTPGVYQCTKSDDTKFAVTVVLEKNPATGEAERLEVQWNAKVHGSNVRSLRAMCREMVEQAEKAAKPSARVA